MDQEREPLTAQKQKRVSVLWKMSRKARNRRTHALNGNGVGGKGKGQKGKKGYDVGDGGYVEPRQQRQRELEMAEAQDQQAERADQERDFRLSMEQAQMIQPPKLVQAEWAKPVRTDLQQLITYGGVAVCKKSSLPEVIPLLRNAVLPTAIITTQSATELHIAPQSYVESTAISCTLLMQDGTMPVKQRYLTQFSKLGGKVTMNTDDLEIADEEWAAYEIILYFHEANWPDLELTPATVAAWTKIHARYEADVGAIQVRRFENRVDAKLQVEDKQSAIQIIRASGQGMVFASFSLQTRQADPSLEGHILWTQDVYEIALAEARQNAGLMVRSVNATLTFGIRFLDEEKFKAAADARLLDKQYKGGRFRLCLIPASMGKVGTTAFCRNLGWAGDLLECEYLGEGTAVMLAEQAPPAKWQKGDGLRVGMRSRETKTVSVVRVAAINKRARDLCKAANLRPETGDEAGNILPPNDDMSDKPQPKTTQPVLDELAQRRKQEAEGQKQRVENLVQQRQRQQQQQRLQQQQQPQQPADLEANSGEKRRRELKLNGSNESNDSQIAMPPKKVSVLGKEEQEAEGRKSGFRAA